ncbi:MULTISPECIES: DUF1833 family protein [Polynucleobacter]|uniref:DUF1833 family protein n=1 Tax=Polynucleobacter TaxID=44013 RepID=UPI001BFEEA61|nr:MULTISPECIES: DUF1833 family protein [Polynucleobacter]QWD55187.1 DUF1833 family protein [Polynucleobacter paneuropaeus]QWE17318.1 DUF1833 family protein [Polynucleobacter sp. AP-Nino-20-G2]
MTRAYSSQFKSTLAAVSAPEAPFILLEISHPLLSSPVRVINDTQDLTSNGNLFIGCPFKCILPDDYEGQLPKARLAVDNVGRDLMYWIETSNGGQGSSVRFMQVMRSRPDLVEWEITMNLYNVVVTMQEITAELGFESLFSKPAISMQYRPDNSAGIF